MEKTTEPFWIATSHRNMDFDAFATVICATLLYPETIAVIPKNVNPNVKAFYSIHKDIFEVHYADLIDFDRVSGLVATDVNAWSRISHVKPLQEKTGLHIIVWDHHLSPGDADDHIHADEIHVEPCGAAITLMIRKLKDENRKIDPMQATLFLAGIYEDTGSMMFPSTTSEDIRAAAYLLDQKADLQILSNFLRPAYGERQKDMLFKMLKSAERSDIDGFSVSFNRQAMDGHLENAAVVVNMYMQILNVDAAFGIFSNNDKCIVIARSRIDGLNVGNIMRRIGGGGHPGAGSALLKETNPEAAEKMIRNIMKGARSSKELIRNIMSFPVVSVPPETPMNQVADLLREKGCTGVPVVEDNKIVGMISRRDFKKLRNRDSAFRAPVKAFMKRNVITIPADKSPLQAARLMVKHDIGRLPVIDNGELSGIVTRSDAMNYFYHSTSDTDTIVKDMTERKALTEPPPERNDEVKYGA